MKYQKIEVSGYFRKNGVWVSPHFRRVKLSNKKIRFRSSKNKNKNQLSFDFPNIVLSGKT